MKIQRRHSAEPKLFWKKFTKYLIGIVLGGLFALLVFVVKDFYSYHLQSPDGYVAPTLSEIACDSKWHKMEVEVERVVSKDSVPKVKVLMYEIIALVWMYQRGEKMIISILFGSTFGALLVMVIQRIRTSRITIPPP